MNLLSKLHKNSILTGPIDSYCLACGCLLRSEEESYAHIHEPEHVDRLHAVPHVESYKDDCIIKTKEGYFCPYCNIILPTIKRVSLHITESKHRDNKNSQSISRHAGAILAFDVVVIEAKSWHGLDDSTCSVCDEDYADEEQHLKEAAHILNLIQARCEFGETYVYRKVDEDLFFCLICNDILSIPDKLTHHESKVHIENYEKSKTECNAIKNQKAIEQSDNNKISVIETNNNTLEIKHIETKKAKDTDDNKLKTQEDKTQNGSSRIIDNNRTTAQEYTQKSNKLDSETVREDINTENVQKQATSQSESHEAAKLKLQEPKTDSYSKNNEEKEKQITTKVSQETTKLNTNKVETPEQNEPKLSLNTHTAEATFAKKTEPVTAKVEKKSPVDVGKVKVEDKAEKDFYDYLKARNFIIKTPAGVSLCTLCDFSIDNGDVRTHSFDKHHSKLYAQHVARTNALSEKTVNGQDFKSAEESNCLKPEVDIVKGKENTSPVIKESNKVEVTKEKAVHKDKNAGLIEQKNNAKAKENQVKPVTKDSPANTAQDDSEAAVKSANEKAEIKSEPTDPNPSKKSNKKAKKAAKAKSSESKPLLKASNENESLPEACKTGTVTEEKPASIDESDLKAQVNEDITNDIEKNDIVENGETNKEIIEVNGIVKDDDEETMASKFASDADLKTEKLLNLINTVSQVDSVPDDVVVNNKYVLGNLSFVLVMRSGDLVECVACEKKLSPDKIHKHIATDGHRTNVEECNVVTSLDDEFIRQVKTQEYHCGYCNIVLLHWDDLKVHLKSYLHKDAKTSALWRLERYQPHLKHCQTREVRSVLSTIFRCTME